MNEKYPQPPHTEDGNGRFYERSDSIDTELTRRLGKVLYSQLDDVASSPDSGLTSAEDYLDKDASLRLAEWTKENADSLASILGDSETSYAPEQLDDAAIKRLITCLLTPRFIYNQRRRDVDHENTKDLKRELSEYNEAIREAVRADPDIPQESLIKLLQGAVMWSKVPYEVYGDSYKTLQTVTNGARGELVMDQLVQSQAAKEAGIIQRKTNTGDDLRGHDTRIMIPIKRRYKRREEQTVMVQVSLDVTFNPDDITREQAFEEQDQTYVFGNRKVSIWPGVTWKEMSDRMTLEESAVEEKAASIIPTLQEIAKKQYIETMRRRGMGVVALGDLSDDLFRSS